MLLKSTERRIESIPRKTLQRFTDLGDFSDNSTVNVTSTDLQPTEKGQRAGWSLSFLICQIGDNEGRFHLLCKDKIAKLLPIKSEKKNCKNTAMDKNHYLTNSLLETKFFPYPSTTEEQML